MKVLHTCRREQSLIASREGSAAERGTPIGGLHQKPEELAHRAEQEPLSTQSVRALPRPELVVEDALHPTVETVHRLAPDNFRIAPLRRPSVRVEHACIAVLVHDPQVRG